MSRDWDSEATRTNLVRYGTRNPAKRLLLRALERQVMAWVDRVAPGSVLDAGCGHGFMLARLLGRRPALLTVGADLSAVALAYAGRLAPRAQLVRADLCHLPLADGRFDLVLCMGVLPYLSDPRAGLRELARVARGHVLLEVPWEPWFRLANLATLNHLPNLGNPGFRYHWGRRSFVRMVAQEMEVLEVAGPFPWTLVLARGRRPFPRTEARPWAEGRAP
ncbi:MAG TPA: class I SAM-dependent methyltransferase [Dehalococcoidia bacterium]|nr:class I SAM-dependent methyltransferase [Dehalococcoidia bacterium]